MRPKDIYRVRTRCYNYQEVKQWADSLGLYGWSLTHEWNDEFYTQRNMPYVVIIYDNIKIGSTIEESIEKIKVLAALRWGVR